MRRLLVSQAIAVRVGRRRRIERHALPIDDRNDDERRAADAVDDSDRLMVRLRTGPASGSAAGAGCASNRDWIANARSGDFRPGMIDYAAASTNGTGVPAAEFGAITTSNTPGSVRVFVSACT